MSVDANTEQKVVEFYRNGLSLREISAHLGGTYKRERIRQVLHHKQVAFRGIGARYKNPSELTEVERQSARPQFQPLDENAP